MMQAFHHPEAARGCVLEMADVLPKNEFVRLAQKVLERGLPEREDNWYLLVELRLAELLECSQPGVAGAPAMVAAIVILAERKRHPDAQAMWSALVGRVAEPIVHELGAYEEQAQKQVEASLSDRLRLDGAALLCLIAESGRRPTLRAVRRALKRHVKAVRQLAQHWDPTEEEAAA